MQRLGLSLHQARAGPHGMPQHRRLWGWRGGAEDARGLTAHLWMRQLAVKLRGVMALDPVGGATGVGGGGAMWAAVPASVMQALKAQASRYIVGSWPVAWRMASSRAKPCTNLRPRSATCP